MARIALAKLSKRQGKKFAKRVENQASQRNSDRRISFQFQKTAFLIASCSSPIPNGKAFVRSDQRHCSARRKGKSRLFRKELAISAITLRFSSRRIYKEIVVEALQPPSIRSVGRFWNEARRKSSPNNTHSLFLFEGRIRRIHHSTFFFGEKKWPFGKGREDRQTAIWKSEPLYVISSSHDGNTSLRVSIARLT